MAIIKIKNPAIDLDAAEIPNLPASKITSGTLDNARISLDAAEIPNLDTAKITTGTLADARLPANALNSNVSIPNQSAFKNIIINGDMSIAQRGTSFSSVTSTQYTLDRWRWTPGSGTGTFTLSQSTDVPSGQGFAKSFKADCTATATPSGTNSIGLKTRFEGQNLQYLKKGTANAESLTLSFWVKSNKTGTYIAELEDNDNSRTINKSYTINSANTWEKKTITYDGDTSGTLNNDNALSFTIVYYINAGSDLQSGTLQTSWGSLVPANRAVGQVNLADSTANEWYITGVQLEAGTTASDFEFLPYDVNLQRCHRYCLILGDAPGGATYDYADNGVIGHYYNTTDFYPNFFFPVPMRSTPGVSFSTTGSGLGDVASQNTAKTGTSAGTNSTSSTNINFRVSTSSANQGSGGAFNFAANDYVILSAEL